MSRIVVIFIALLGLMPLRGFAQTQRLPSSLSEPAEAEGEEPEEDEIETDRDSFTPATTVVGLQRIVFESAYTFIDNRRVPETHSFPEIVLRYGLSDRLELRFGTNYEIGGAGNPISGNVPDDFSDSLELEEETNVSYGLKYALTKQSGLTPRSAILVNGFTPVSGEAADTHVAMTFVTGWKLFNGWDWDSAIRYSTGSTEEDRFGVWSPSTVLKIPVGEKWKAHIEYFGVFSDGREDETVQQFVSPGAHYLISPDLEIGARVGWGLNDEAPNFFANVGVGYRY